MPQPISEVFLRELLEVRKEALALDEAVNRHNFLPAEFPVRQVRLLNQSLIGLPEGSLEGAKLPLEHAAVRFSEIRRSFFLHSEQSNSVEVSEEVVPGLERGDALDNRFVILLSSISTALDAYREQARVDFESYNAPEYLEYVDNPSPLKKVDRVEGYIRELDELSRTATGREWEESQKVRNVGLYAADARNSLAATRSEVASKVVIREWFRRLALFSADTLAGLRVAIESVSTGGGVAFKYYLKYKKTISRIRDVAIEEAKGWLEEISADLKIAEEKIRGKFNDEKEKMIGYVETIRGDKVIVDRNSVIYALLDKDVKIPGNRSTVEFTASNIEGARFASQVIQSKKYMIVDTVVFDIDVAREILLEEAVKFMIALGKTAYSPAGVGRHLYRSLKLSKVFWKPFGVRNLGDFFLGDQRIFCYPEGDVPSIISVRELNIGRITKENVADWAYEYVRENGGRSDLGPLALKAASFFVGADVPIRKLVGVPMFSEIFSTDSRFQISKGSISIASSAETTI